MSRITMRAVRPGEIPKDGGTAIQDDPDRPVFRGAGPDDYVCVTCGNVLAARMDSLYMTKKVRVKCGRCKTINVAITDEGPDGDPRVIARRRREGRGS